MNEYSSTSPHFLPPGFQICMFCTTRDKLPCSKISVQNTCLFAILDLHNLKKPSHLRVYCYLLSIISHTEKKNNNNNNFSQCPLAQHLLAVCKQLVLRNKIITGLLVLVTHGCKPGL